MILTNIEVQVSQINSSQPKYRRSFKTYVFKSAQNFKSAEIKKFFHNQKSSTQPKKLKSAEIKMVFQKFKSVKMNYIFCIFFK